MLIKKKNNDTQSFILYSFLQIIFVPDSIAQTSPIRFNKLNERLFANDSFDSDSK